MVCLKNQVYTGKPASLDEIKKNVKAFARSVTHDTCKRVIENFVVRVNACANRGGRLVEHVNYQKC